MTLAPLLAIAAFAVMPAAAQAESHYFRNGVLIPEGKKVPQTISWGITLVHLPRWVQSHVRSQTPRTSKTHRKVPPVAAKP